MRKRLRWPAAAVIALLVVAMPAVPPATAGAWATDASSIDLKALLHDTRDLRYRSPFGAVPAGTRVTLRLRTAHHGASSVILDVQARDPSGTPSVSLRQTMRLGAQSKRYDLWQTILTPKDIGIYSYGFQITQGNVTDWYSSVAPGEGGTGQAYPGKSAPDVSFGITVYDPSFHVPSWATDAVIYQIFPDRFFNGDPSNDTKVMDPAYAGVHPVFHKSWNELPVALNKLPDPTFVNDFFGGDLQGIIDKLPYLQQLGVNTLYLNPIFLAPSNHKYDTSDYFTIDPHFGTLETFQRLIADARADGIRIILDGVFNHTGSDSIYFNRYGHFPDVGAYQSKQSRYYPWYTFASWPTSYSSFFGYDWLPQLNENDPVKDFIFRRPDSVAQHWLSQGSAGWRLDAAHLRSHSWWQEFRQASKARYPDDILIGETDVAPIDATPWLFGNELDGVMNYRFRAAMLHFFARGRGTGTPFPITAHGLYRELAQILEDYPLPAIYSSMNLVDSHDTERILYDLLGDKRELKEVATLQLSWPGAPTIYYGDEAGLTGGSDPDNRRTFPWDRQDTNLEAYYRTLIATRQANPALRDGSVAPLVLDDQHRLFVYLRRDRKQSVAVALNDGTSLQRVALRLQGLPDGTSLRDALSGTRYTMRGGALRVTVGAKGAAILVQAPR